MPTELTPDSRPPLYDTLYESADEPPAAASAVPPHPVRAQETLADQTDKDVLRAALIAQEAMAERGPGVVAPIGTLAVGPPASELELASMTGGEAKVEGADESPSPEADTAGTGEVLPLTEQPMIRVPQGDERDSSPVVAKVPGDGDRETTTPGSGEQESEEAQTSDAASGSGGDDGREPPTGELPADDGDESGDDDGEDIEELLATGARERESTTGVAVDRREIDELISVRVVRYEGSPENSAKIADAVRPCDVVAIKGPYCETAEEQRLLEQTYTNAIAATRSEWTPEGESEVVPPPQGDISGTLSHLEGSGKEIILLGITGEDPEAETIHAFDEGLREREAAFENAELPSEAWRVTWRAATKAVEMQAAEHEVLRRQIDDLVDSTIDQAPLSEVGIVIAEDCAEVTQEIGRLVAPQPIGRDVARLWHDPEGEGFFDRAVRSLGDQAGEKAEECVNKYVMARLLTEYMPGEYPSQSSAEEQLSAVPPDKVEHAFTYLGLGLYFVPEVPQDRREGIRQLMPGALTYLDLQ